MSSETMALTPPELLALLRDRGVPEELLSSVAQALLEDQRRSPPSPVQLLEASTVPTNSRSALAPPSLGDMAAAPPHWWSLRTAQTHCVTLLSLPDPVLSTILRAALGEQTDFAPMVRSLGAAVCAKVRVSFGDKLPTRAGAGHRSGLSEVDWIGTSWSCQSGLVIEPWMVALSSRADSWSSLPVSEPAPFPIDWQTRGAQLSAVSKHLRLLTSSASPQPQTWQHCSVCERNLRAMSTEWFAQDLSERVSPEAAMACRQPWLAKASTLGGQTQQLISPSALRSLEKAARTTFGPLAQMCAAEDCSRYICYMCINADKVARCAQVANNTRMMPWHPATSGSRWIIPCGSKFCPDCAPEPCQVCSRRFGQPCCGGMEMGKCILCPLIACLECEDCWTCKLCKGDFHERCKQSQFCDGCETDFCNECDVQFLCDGCEQNYCSDCSNDSVACSTCTHRQCNSCSIHSDEPIRQCDYCNDRFCANCQDVTYCHYCEKESCSGCHAVKYCSICAIGSCTDCLNMIQCESCGEYTCPSCSKGDDCTCFECADRTGVKHCADCGSCFCRHCISATLTECSRCEYSFCHDCHFFCDCESCGISLCKDCFPEGSSESQLCGRCVDRQALKAAKILLSQTRASAARTAELLDKLKWEQAAGALRRNTKLMHSQSPAGFAAPIETAATGTSTDCQEWKPTFLGRGLYPKNCAYVNIHNPNCAFWSFDGDGVPVEPAVPMDVVSVNSPWVICDPRVLDVGFGQPRTLEKPAALVDFVCMSLGCAPDYEETSPEELRLADHLSGKLHTDPMSIVTTDEFGLQLGKTSTPSFVVSACPGPYPWHWALHKKCYYLDTPEEDRLAFLMMARASASSPNSQEKADRYSRKEAIHWHNLNLVPDWSSDRHGCTSWDRIQEQLPSEPRMAARRVRAFRRKRTRN